MSERSEANDRVAFEISLCIYIYMYVCTLRKFMSRAFVSLLRWPLVALARLDHLSGNQTQHLSAETVGQQSARLTQMHDTSRQCLYVYTLSPYPFIYL